MPDKKLTDSEITVTALKKILESKLYDGDLQTASTISKAVDLINRQQAEIEKKDRAFENLIEVARLWKEKYSNAKKELFDKTEQLKTAKAEAVKEFAERLKAEYSDFDEKYEMILPENINKAIDDLLKEMAGERG